MLKLAVVLAALAIAHACTNGKYQCNGNNVAVCNHGKLVDIPCAAGQTCKMYGATPACVAGTGGDKPATDGPTVTDGPTDGPVEPPSGDKLVSFNDFKAGVTACGYPAPSQEKYNNAVGLAKKDGGITTKREFAMFLTQIMWESDGLRAKSEYRCKSNNCAGEYVWAQCPAEGNGKYFFGRGYIQLTWCYNYKDASQDLFGDLRLVKNPEKVASEDSLAWATAFWFWKKRVHSAAGVQQGQFGSATRTINGGYN